MEQIPNMMLIFGHSMLVNRFPTCLVTSDCIALQPPTLPPNLLRLDPHHRHYYVVLRSLCLHQSSSSQPFSPPFSFKPKILITIKNGCHLHLHHHFSHWHRQSRSLGRHTRRHERKRPKNRTASRDAAHPVQPQSSSSFS